MESSMNSEVRRLCRAVSEESDLERFTQLLEELFQLLDERQLLASLL